jgi:steroid delta-isomerase-like uncharacterized protein
MTVQNRALSRRWFDEIWNERRTDTIEEFLGPESVGHLPGGDMTGAEPFKQLHAEFLAAFPDLKVEVEDSISDGDNVVVRWRASGTHDGDGLGFEATHQPVSFRGITWFRIEDGRFVEGWDSWNQEALVQRLREGSDERRDLALKVRQDMAARIRAVREDRFGEHGGPELARRLNLPARTWYNYENGVTVPAEVLLGFIEETGVNPVWLLNGEGPQYQSGKQPELSS